MNKAAICAFVKTPGVSPVKSRLAAACGVNKAESFYFASVNDTENLLRSLKDIAPEIIPWWAVAEEEAHNNSLWASFQKIEQGPG